VRRLPLSRTRLRWLLVVIAAPALLGAIASAVVDWRHLPLVSNERFVGVLLVDGEAYFGHLDDDGTGGDIRLSDVYYFEDAQKGSSGLALGLRKRGGEAHQPADTMHINRDHVLAVEALGDASPVVRAIAAQRALGRDVASSFLERRLVGDSLLVDVQRAATENDIARGFRTATQTLDKTKDLVLKISEQQAATFRAKGMDDLRTVRHAALVALGTTVGMTEGAAETYAKATEARLDAPNDVIVPTLLAPDLYAIVARADQLYGQATDATVQQMTSAK
jgi:hypothetical protein